MIIIIILGYREAKTVGTARQSSHILIQILSMCHHQELVLLLLLVTFF